jgi:hypothetical protein
MEAEPVGWWKEREERERREEFKFLLIVGSEHILNHTKFN